MGRKLGQGRQNIWLAVQVGRPVVNRARRFLPVRPRVNPAFARATLRALHLGSESRHQRITGIARHVDHRLVATGVIEAIGNQAAHTLAAHVGEVHRRAERVPDLVGAGGQGQARTAIIPTPRGVVTDLSQ